MELPRKWYTIDNLCKKWECSTDDVLHLIETNELTPSVNLYEGVELYEVDYAYDVSTDENYLQQKYTEPETSDKGIYDIINYSNLIWEYRKCSDNQVSDLACDGVYLYNPVDDKRYSVAFGYGVASKDIIFKPETVHTFENKHTETVDSALTIPNDYEPLNSVTLVTTPQLNEIYSERPIEKLLRTKEEKNARYANFCESLKSKHIEDHIIAKELKLNFPDITPKILGKIITQKEGVTVAEDTYRTRGNRLLSK